jgi:cell division protein FtsW
MRINRTSNSRIGQWWWTIDHYLLMAILAVLAVGILLVMAASPAVAEHNKLSSFHFVYRQMIYVLVGLGLMAFCSAQSVVWLRRASAIGFVACVAMMLYVVMFTTPIKGAKSWLQLPGFGVQPSEFMKPCLVMMTAWALARQNLLQGYKGFFLAVLFYTIAVGLLMLQPDFGMTMLVSAVFGFQLFLAGLPLLWVAMVFCCGVGGLVGAYFTLPHVAKRINLFVNPDSGDNYQWWVVGCRARWWCD